MNIGFNNYIITNNSIVTNYSSFINRLNEEVVKALATAEVKERFVTLGADAWTMKPDQFDAYIRDEIKSNAVLVKAAGLSPAP